jgi:hypothetical protein
VIIEAAGKKNLAVTEKSIVDGELHHFNATQALAPDK